MSKTKVVLLAVLIAGSFFAECATAQDFSTAAEPAKKKYDAKVEELRAKYQTDLKTTTAEYLAKLDETIKIVTARGDLDKVLIYKAEKEAVETDKPVADTPVSLKILQPIRAPYELKKKAVIASYEKGAKLAQTQLLTDLDAVIKEETKEGRLESALKVRDLKKEVEKAPVPPADALAAKPSVNEAIPSPAKPEPNALEKRGEWIQLFNGKDLTGWKTHGNPKTVWQVEDGVLVGKTPNIGACNLYSEKADYKNVHFRIETMLSLGWNSSQYLRWNTTDPMGKLQDYGYGYKIDIGGTEKGEAAKTGDLYLGHDKLLVDAPEFSVKRGEWFTQEAIANDNKITVLINGKLVTEYTDKDKSLVSGHLGVACRGRSTVRFKKIEVRILPDK
jgi:hypothetical protein